MSSPSEIKKMAKQAYHRLLAGENRDNLLQELQQRLGPEGIFAFGQTEYYERKRKPQLPCNVEATT